MRIVFVSQYYPPEPGAPAARVSELARAWAAAGHTVTVLTGFPHHPTGIVPSAYRGRVFVREHDAGVDVVRTFVYATPNRGVLRRSVGYGSFAASALALGPWAPEIRRADVVVATSPQFLVAVCGSALARALRAPFVLEIRDLWPQSIVELGVWPPGHPAVTLMRRLERRLYDRADRLIAVTHAFAATWAAAGVDMRKVHVIPNGVDLERFRPEGSDDVRHRRGWEGDFVVAYVGTHGLAQGLEQLLAAAARLRAVPDLRFVFVGDGAERAQLQARARALDLPKVEFLGSRPREEIPGLLRAADLLAVPLRRLAVFEQVIPSKLFEIMGCGRPILLAAEGEAARLVEAAQAGWVVPPEDVEALAAAIRAAHDAPELGRARGRQGRAFVEAHFDRRDQASRYLDLLLELVAARRPPADPRRARGARGC